MSYSIIIDPMNTWILVASASEAYLYSSKDVYAGELQLLEELKHPESREKGVELASDRPGHYATDHSARSAYEKSHPKEEAAEVFAIQLARLLKDGNYNHDYEQLIFIAAPHFYGLVNKHIDFKVDKFIHIPKDYTKYDQRELISRLNSDLRIK